MADALSDPYLVNRDSDLHLRDARHAHQLYTQHNFALAPKTKFLYHVVFDFSAPRQFIPNSDQFRKELGVLAHTVSLPSYKTDVDTKHQYNRKKNVQTGINYDEVTFTFHDDNTGVTRALLEEYYRFYFRDGGKHENGVPLDFNARDKFSGQLPRYGMDNFDDPGKGGTFFNYIRIYQLSRHKWVSYTLVNPLITAFSHDDLSYGDGSGIMANKINVAYEAVMYDSGDINPNSEPAGFTSPETRYDVVHSPLQSNETYGADVAQTGAGRGIEPTLIKQSPGITQGNGILRSIAKTVFGNPASTVGDPLNTLNKIVSYSRNPTIGGLQQISVPTPNTRSNPTISSLSNTVGRNLNSDAIVSTLGSNRSALNSTVKRVLAAGAFGPEWNSSNFGNFDRLSRNAQFAIERKIVESVANGDRRIGNIATQVIKTLKGKR